jgi:hypothetical protein
MNTISIKRKLKVCRRCEFLCARCPHALPCEAQGQRVRPVECYLCWHNQGTVLPTDCGVRHRAIAPAGKGLKRPARPSATPF